MRVLPFLALALPALASAQQPLIDQAKGYWEKAQGWLKSAASVPADAGASKVAEKTVTPLTMQNWQSVMKHSGMAKKYNPPEAWMVYVTGGNYTWRDRVDRAWNESVALFQTDVSAPNLASVDCDNEEILCGAWAADMPSIWFFLLPHPQPDQSSAPTDIVIYNLNVTTTTSTDITRIHTRKTYLSRPKYEGPLHPFDGWIAKYGLTNAVAYGVWGIAKIPSWAMMVAITMVSRYFVYRRMPTAGGQSQANRDAAAPAQ